MDQLERSLIVRVEFNVEKQARINRYDKHFLSNASSLVSYVAYLVDSPAVEMAFSHSHLVL